MPENTCKIKVRYGETDQMGIVNNAHYASYYEIGRTEWLNQLGFSYKQMEEDGILLPVIDLYCRYLHPAYYDDILVIKTVVNTLPSSRIRFDYSIFNQEMKLINQGYSQHAFVNAKSRRPHRAPQFLLNALESHF